jgi:ubiquinone/menaquinone biosynthesis C-methylase UbiE
VSQLVPALRPALWRLWYNRLASRDEAGQLLFMNYGYHDEGLAQTLLPADEPFRYAIQLYAHVVGGIDLTAKDVLEVGCGRGGGGSFYVRYLNPRSYTGVDLSDTAIAWCQRKLDFPNAKWLEGRADAIPTAPGSVDVVVNVESSHSYPSMPTFLKEVTRVLRLGGYFAFCDVRMSEHIPELERQLYNSGLTRVDNHLITKNVLRALEAISPQREQQINTQISRVFRPAFRDLFGVRDSALYNLMVAGDLCYVYYLLQKPKPV